MMEMFDSLFTAQAGLSLLTLAALEIVLGIDNIIFISILAGKLPPDQAKKARQWGIFGAFFTRITLLFGISLIMRLTEPVVTLFGHGFSGKALILLSGGLFLLYKATTEIHDKLEGEDVSRAVATAASFAKVIAQIMILDMVFSIDSIITAVGMTNNILIMVIANMIALIVMLVSAGTIADFVGRHPTVKVLALSFLLMIGMMLVVEAFGVHVPHGYLYFAMGFSIFVEFINMKVRKTAAAPVQLHRKPLE